MTPSEKTFKRAFGFSLVMLLVILTGCGEKKYELSSALPEHNDRAFYQAYCDVHISHIGIWTYKGDQPVWGEISSLNSHDSRVVEKMSQVSNVYHLSRDRMEDVTSEFEDNFLETVRVYLHMAEWIEKQNEDGVRYSTYLRNLQFEADFEVRNMCVQVGLDRNIIESKIKPKFNVRNIEIQFLNFINS